MPSSLIKVYIILALALVAALPEQSYSSDAELTAHFQEMFSDGYCVSEVLVNANVERSRCTDAWKAPVSICAEKTGLFEFVTSSELSEEAWAAQLEAETYELTVCIFSVLGNGVDDQDNPDRAIYRAIIEYDDTLRGLEEAQPD